MTIRWVRTARASAKKTPQAMGWAKEIAAWAKKKVNVDLRVSMSAAGEVGLIRWEADHPDMKTLEETMTAVLADQEYWAMVGKAMTDELFIDGTSKDEIFKQF